MLIQLLLALSLTSGNALQEADLNQLVTIEQRAAPVSVAVAQLAAATKTPLSASAALWSEVIAFKVKDVKLIDLMNRIGDATSCEWFKTDQGYAMRRSNSKVYSDDKNWLTSRTLTIRKRLEKLRAALPGPMTPQQVADLKKQREDLQKEMENASDPSIWQRYAALQQKEPSQTLMTEAMLMLGPIELASVGRNERVVFSTRPTRMQKPMPAGFSAAYGRYLTAKEAWGEDSYSDFEGPMMDEFDDSDQTTAPDFPDEPTTARVAAVNHIIVERNDQFMPGSLTIRLESYDHAGQSIGAHRSQIDSMDEEFAESLMNDFKPRDGETEIKLSAESLEYGKLLSPQMAAQANDTANETRAKWRDRILHLDKYEPLSYGASEMVFALADDKAANLVAVIPDLFAMFTPSLGDEFKLTVRTLRTLLTSLPLVTLTEEPGWMTIRPSFPSESRLARTNRPAAASYLKEVGKAGRASVDVLANYVASSEALSFDNLGLMLQSVILGTRSMESYSVVQREALLRFYGRLRPEQRSLLLRGGSLSLVNLTPELAAPVHQILFGAGARLSRDDPRIDSPEDSGEAAEYLYDDYSSGGGSLVTEPTQSMPNGIPSGATVTVTSNSRPHIQTYEKADQENVFSSPQPLQSVAFQIYSRERPDLFPWAQESRPRPYYKVFAVTDLLFSFNVGSKLSSKRRLRDAAPVSTGPPVKFEELPSAIRDEIMRLVAKQREQYKDQKPGEGIDGYETESP